MFVQSLSISRRFSYFYTLKTQRYEEYCSYHATVIATDCRTLRIPIYVSTDLINIFLEIVSETFSNGADDVDTPRASPCLFSS